jgi:hypothetical protein
MTTSIYRKQSFVNWSIQPATEVVGNRKTSADASQLPDAHRSADAARNTRR